MEKQKQKPREPQPRCKLCVMWNDGNPKEADNCDVNAKKYIEKEWTKKAVGLDSALLKTATISGSSNRTKYYEKWKKNFAVRRSSNDNGFLARFSKL